MISYLTVVSVCYTGCSKRDGPKILFSSFDCVSSCGAIGWTPGVTGYKTVSDDMFLVDALMTAKTVLDTLTVDAYAVFDQLLTDNPTTDIMVFLDRQTANRSY